MLIYRQHCLSNAHRGTKIERFLLNGNGMLTRQSSRTKTWPRPFHARATCLRITRYRFLNASWDPVHQRKRSDTRCSCCSMVCQLESLINGLRVCRSCKMVTARCWIAQDQTHRASSNRPVSHQHLLICAIHERILPVHQKRSRISLFPSQEMMTFHFAKGPPSRARPLTTYIRCHTSHYPQIASRKQPLL